MHRKTLAAFLLALVFGSLPAIAADNKPPPIADFFQNPAFSNAVLSPSGRLLAVVVGAKDSRDRLAVLDLDTMKVQAVASYSDADVVRPVWVNDKRLVFSLADRRLAEADRWFAPGLFAVNADGSGLRQLVQREPVFAQDGIGTRQLPWNTFLLHAAGAQRGDDVLVVQPEVIVKNRWDFARLLKLNTVNNRAEPVDTPSNAFSWLIDAQGQVRAVRTEREGRAAVHWREQGGKWRVLREFDRFTGVDFALRYIGADDRLLAVARGVGTPRGDTLVVTSYDPATDQLGAQPLAATPQFDLEPQFIASDDKLLGLRFTVDAQVTQWLDEGMKAHQFEVDKLLPATANMLTPPRRGNSPWILVRAFSDVQPALYFVFNIQTKRLTRLGGEQPGIKPAQMSPMDLVRYKARDGLEIPAYLTLPVAAEPKKNLPLIVWVHGGPWVRGATWQWQAPVQFLASRGYAVMQPEFRGSTGFGSQHFRAGFKQWGLAMQDDLADAARWAIAQGIADPRRICIMGASYGGYATLMGLAKDGDLFRCGVQWLGVADMQLLFDKNWGDINDEFRRWEMPQLIGDRQKDAAQLDATSPVKQAARIKNPLLMAYGGADLRVPIEHGRRFFDAVKPHNPNAEFVEYEKEGHGWALPATELDWWSRVEVFLARHLAARP
jgi:dipeptidyl aminopeptidase/acylaminoacyl peptidase